MNLNRHIEIAPNDYQDFREFLEKRVGIVLGENKQYLVTSRIGHFLKDHNMKSLSELLAQIHKPGQSKLMQEVVDAMTTNETLWFRDQFPFDILKTKLFPERLVANKNIKVWSAACSSGQEPYSIAITWDEFIQSRNISGASLNVVGTDISNTILNCAKEGVYDELALRRGLSDSHRKKYFTPYGDGLLQVNQSIKQLTSFRSLNLLDANFGFSQYDIVFCRNVLIYFSQQVKQEVLDKICKMLKPGGYLFLGASESMSGLSERFEMIRCNPGLVYKLKP